VILIDDAPPAVDPAVAGVAAEALEPVPVPGAVALAALSERATSPPDAVEVAESFLPFPLRPLHAASPNIDAHATAAATRSHLFTI
jgi:hypothetical protein